MKSLIATYSNGTTDEYKGKRLVTAGWAIIKTETNEIIKSGHSMTRKLAESCAKGNMPKPYGELGFMKKIGSISPAEARALTKKQAEFRNGYTIEIANL